MDVVAAAIGAVMPFVCIIPADDDVEFNTSIFFTQFFHLFSATFYFRSFTNEKKKLKSTDVDWRWNSLFFSLTLAGVVKFTRFEYNRHTNTSYMEWEKTLV